METESASKSTALNHRVLGNDVFLRCQHTSTLLGMNIITIGGTGRDPMGTITYFNDVVSFNLPNKTVERLQIEGDNFPARKGHTACLYGRNQIVIFGGSDSEGVKKEIGILSFSDEDVFKARWERITPSGTGIYRANHTACIYGNKLYIFGGKDQNEKLPKYSFFCLSLITHSSEWGVLDMINYMPSKRWGHSSTIIKDQMVIYGGHDDKQFLSDMWIYNFGNSLWTQVTQAKGQIPLGRRGASLDCLDGKLYIFGGSLALVGHCDEFYSFDLESQNWEKLQVNTPGLPSRSYHTSICLKGSLVIWGGQSIVTYIQSISAIEFSGNSSEQKLEEHSLVMQGRDNAYFNQMRRLYEEKLFADILFFVQGEEITAHKGIIAARSKFFEHMFLSGMVESQATRIEIKDMKADTFKAMLHYLYLNEVELTKNRATELLEMSDKYVLGELKTLCEQYLSQIISLHNFISLAEISEKFEATLLQENIVSFAVGHLDQINNTVNDEILRLSKKMLWSIALKINQSVKSRNNPSIYSSF